LAALPPRSRRSVIVAGGPKQLFTAPGQISGAHRLHLAHADIHLADVPHGSTNPLGWPLWRHVPRPDAYLTPRTARTCRPALVGVSRLCQRGIVAVAAHSFGCPSRPGASCLSPRVASRPRSRLAQRALPPWQAGVGSSSQVLPSSVRPVLLLLTPPHCLKKKGTRAATHWFLMLTAHASSSGRAPGPDSPPCCVSQRSVVFCADDRPKDFGG
jgi:hypothetical protein